MGGPIPDGRPAGLFGTWNTYQNCTEGWTSGPNTYPGREVVSLRKEKSINKLVPIPGTSSLFRQPSSYGRSVRRFTLINPCEFRENYQNWSNRTWIINGVSNHMSGYEFANFPGFCQGGVVTGQGGYGYDPSPNTVSRLNTEVMLNLKDQKSDLGAALATAKQTASLFSSLSSTAFKSLASAKRGNWKGAFGALGLAPRGKPIGHGLAQRYLEYSYGLAPLLSDIYGTYELLQEQLEPALLISAKRTITTPGSHEETNDVSVSYPHSGKVTTRWVGRRVDRIKVIAVIDSALARNVSRAGLTNPAAVAWELVPWSFAVDWTMPIGNVLQALDAHVGLQFVGGFRSHLVDCQGTITYGGPDSDKFRKIQPYILNQGVYSFQRVKLGGFPRPSVYSKSPFTSVKRALNAAALLRMLF